MEQKTPYRINSIDVLRGIVMIIMALDHTRDFFHITAMTANPLDPATGGAPLYFTRWITHFCAPIFVFLSGTSAFLSAKNKNMRDASNFMIKRGFWLVFIEMAVITLGLTFNPIYSFIIWQVIWAIGWSMILLGILMRISFNAVLIVGLLLFFGHNIFDYLTLPQTGVVAYLYKIFFTAAGTVLPVSSGHFIGIFYAILPWSGAMLLGYCIGQWFSKEFAPATRKQRLLLTGSILVVLFFVLRITGIYGNPVPWNGTTIYSLLDTSKYPPSLQYFCMTLGPAMLFLALFENVHAGWTRIVSVYGRVPFFYYVLHFYLLHFLLVIVFFATGHNTSQIIDMQVPFLFRPSTFGFGLGIVYLIWITVVVSLYFPCRWFNQYKKTHRQWWLSYL